MTMLSKGAITAAVLLLTACQTGTHQGSEAVDPALDRCQASRYQQFVGQPLSAVAAERFAQPVRAIPWNAAVTMDFNLNRLNFMADKSNTITRVYCG
ncbi:I78 family peptidase inhibitor [Pantoea sp. 1.19]|uniref:I78 family peptidase inhibitor n=1 Tax=Pantoea sp. 1.19 TaxID=1925589 RepID=UPI000948E4B7|nr:I78 family peptidase inhibitor [Pantoea sp. 1.19]